MPRLSFITPFALVLLVLLPLMWGLALVAPRRLPRWRRWAALALRSAIVVACVLALAGVQVGLPVSQVATVFLLDRSDSVAPAQQQRAEAFVSEALRTLPQGDSAAVVVFGANALVERAPAAIPAALTVRSVPVGTRTNIQDAIQLGLALTPADTQQRLVLLSDGGETSGTARDAARLARARGVPIDVVDLPASTGDDTLLVGLDAPATASEGQLLPITIAVRSSVATTGRLELFVDGEVVASRDGVTIAPGDQSVQVELPAGRVGLRRIEARLTAEGDTVPQNNRAAGFTEIRGPPQVLLVASQPARALPLQQALAATGVQAVVQTPQQAPADLAVLREYAAVLLVDTPANAMPRALLEALPVYVRDLGRGFAMVGGTDSFGAGGYRRTLIEPMLPVLLDPLAPAERPDVALVLVIDRSGSMTEAAGADGRGKLALAKDAVFQASLGLGPSDQFGIVAFDSNAEAVLPMQPLPQAATIQDALSQFNGAGGTNIRPGVELAADMLATVDARVKHVILLTDGEADSNYRDLVEQLRADQITVSTVSIGSSANANLQDIANAGGGRFYRVPNAAAVPQIFLQETVTVAGRDIVREQFTPQIALESAVTRGVSGFPPLYGYNGTTLKDAATATLVAPDGQPILAEWQFGLGRVAAWTSDFKNDWARDWLAWDGFPRLVNALISTLQPAVSNERLSLDGREVGGTAQFELVAQQDDGAPLNDLALDGRLIGPQNSVVPFALTQVGPGRYRAQLPASEDGVYFAQVAVAGQQGPLGTVSTGVVVSYSPEYGERRADPGLLAELAQATGGRAGVTPAQSFDSTGQEALQVRELGLPLLWLALLLLPLDIAVRRVFLPRPAWVPRRHAAPQPRVPALVPLPPAVSRRPGDAAPPPASAAEQYARLRAAKRRARPSADETE